MTRFWSRIRGQARNAVPEHLLDAAIILGMPASIRTWADQPMPGAATNAERAAESLRAAGHDDGCLRWLAISGGGQQGAFAAGLLKGWTRAGNRPVFQAVTGVSTGALAAPLAFLGWDDHLEQVYTRYATKDLLRKRPLVTALFSDAFMDTSPLERVIAHHIDERALDAIATEHARGRRLFVGTTNLDTMRPVRWRLGDIAASGHPGALALIRKVMLASASISAAFPLVRIEVEVDGQRYDELHGDGGTTSQVFLYPFETDMQAVLAAAGFSAESYIIRNTRLDVDWKPVERTLSSLTSGSVGALLRAQGFGDLYRIFLTTKRDGIGFNLAYIPETFTARSTEPFDLRYMRQLFDLGCEMAASGYPWEKHPPGYD